MTSVAQLPELLFGSLLLGVVAAGYWYAVLAAERFGVGPRNESDAPVDDLE